MLKYFHCSSNHLAPVNNCSHKMAQHASRILYGFIGWCQPYANGVHILCIDFGLAKMSAVVLRMESVTGDLRPRGTEAGPNLKPSVDRGRNTN